jgi:eukaryotic-like serine/threonine-protein kinase
MRLLQKILLFVAALIVALVGGTLLFTTVQADRLARATIREGLEESREIWQAVQADRFNKLRLGVRVLANDPPFKAALVETDQATAFDTMRERGRDVAADFMLVTGPAGAMVARTDRPGAAGDDLSRDPLVRHALDGEESATLWRQGDQLFTAVAVPMTTGGELVGALVAGYALNEAVASQLRRLTHGDVAFLLQDPGQPPRVLVSSLGPREGALAPAVAAAGAAADGTEPFELDLGGERHVALRIPLQTAGGPVVGSTLALRSLAAETAAFRQFRRSLLLVSLGVATLALALAWLAASRITGPLRRLVSLVESVRDGSYRGAVSVPGRGEIGVLARAFGALVADLREKEQMIAFLRDGITAARADAVTRSAAAAGTTAAAPAEATVAAASPDAPTVALAPQATRPATSPASASLQPGETFAGRYEVLGSLGRGGMGVVYRARDTQLDEMVALKLLRPDALEMDPSLLERFKLEIRLARRITHRNVLRTHDFGEAAGVPYISMEYVDGVNLKDVIRGRGALPLGVGLSIAKQMCHGLAAAHEMGVVHRDVKPHNMMILPETGDVKIMDFGISRVQSVGDGASGLTTAGTVMGTPDYMPPEQAQGRPADFRSDLYSLGVVLFEIFTGRLPFAGEGVAAVLLAHVQQPPPRPRSVHPGLPPELEGVILRALEKEPSRRWQTADALEEVLSAVSGRASVAA